VPLFPTDSKVKALARAPLFEGLSRGELEELAKVTEDLDDEAGKVLCREGETAREFFVIIDGEVGVAKRGEEIRTLSKGDFFGEIGLLEDVPRTATVTAKTPVRYFVLTRQSFRGLLERQREIERKVMRAFADRVRPALERDPTTG
jgi:CRP/FNR family cyclic AMP-dependent transcriptional regulator